MPLSSFHHNSTSEIILKCKSSKENKEMGGDTSGRLHVCKQTDVTKYEFWSTEHLSSMEVSVLIVPDKKSYSRTYGENYIVSIRGTPFLFRQVFVYRTLGWSRLFVKLRS